MTISHDSKQQYSTHTSESAKNRPYIKMSNKDSSKDSKIQNDFLHILGVVNNIVTLFNRKHFF